VLRQQTRSSRIFLPSPYTRLTLSLLRRIESGSFIFTRIPSGDFNSVSVLGLATDIVTAESNESHFHDWHHRVIPTRDAAPSLMALAKHLI
jgi:hypothetical protein